MHEPPFYSFFACRRERLLTRLQEEALWFLTSEATLRENRIASALWFRSVLWASIPGSFFRGFAT